MIVGIIPARGGSKGIPGKNLKELGKKHLIDYTIDAAINSRLINQIEVSSEDDGILDSVYSYRGAVNTLRRPFELAQDHVQVDEVVLYVLRQLEIRGRDAIELVVVLQPTSPFRTGKHIDEAIEQYRAVNTKTWPLAQNHTVFSAYQPEGYAYMMAGATALPIDHNPEKRSGRQYEDPPDLAIENGAIYVVDAKRLSSERTFRAQPMSPYFMGYWESMEIDNMGDWFLAEAYLENKHEWK
jgi:CMP-N,N'-diacetyllegionaminic acid synthase